MKKKTKWKICNVCHELSDRKINSSYLGLPNHRRHSRLFLCHWYSRYYRVARDSRAVPPSHRWWPIRMSRRSMHHSHPVLPSLLRRHYRIAVQNENHMKLPFAPFHGPFQMNAIRMR